MAFKLKSYKDRKIEFIEVTTVNNWHVKVYTITNKESFNSVKALGIIVNNLKNWLPTSSILPIHDCAFLVVHEGREGIWILINWWTDGEMLETKLYFIDYKDPTKITKSIYEPKRLICVWELEIVIHERKAWINHILKKASNPDFKNYLTDYLIQ